ncbi:MAG: DUF4380 domain-containing protein [Firmicutes bacterium]|nr:DUF4380 domain-containing protein [Bacillota bacterium]
MITAIETYPPFGRALRMENRHVKLFVTLDVGPRIIHFGRPDGENLFFVDSEGVTDQPLSGLTEKFGTDAVYRFYGGHRLWVWPEEYGWTYCPDNAPVTTEERDSITWFTPPPQAENGLQLSLGVRLNDETGQVTIFHKVQNIGREQTTLALWGITQMANGGVEIIPQSKRDTGLKLDRTIALWPYTDMGDSRITWGDDAILLRGDRAAERPIKFGLRNRHGWAAYCLENLTFLKRFAPGPEDQNPFALYPDEGCSFETYTNSKFVEIESLGPVVEARPGESATLIETWSLHDGTPEFEQGNPSSALAFAQKIIKAD